MPYSLIGPSQRQVELAAHCGTGYTHPVTRIVAGTYGGRVLGVPEQGTRPTSERVREAIFSRLDHYDALEDTNVLDLFAGSGALAIEALSRGARRAVLVEASQPAAAVCRTNLTTLKITSAQVITNKAQDFVVRKPATPWDVVFLDPPYNIIEEELTAILAALVPSVDDRAVIVVERPYRSPEPTLPSKWRMITDKKYGDTVVYYIEPDLELDL